MSKITIEDWLAKPEFANKLKELMSDPVMQIALEIVKDNSLANSLATSGNFVSIPDKGSLLGYDVGRLSAIQDLKKLCEVSDNSNLNLEPEYNNI